MRFAVVTLFPTMFDALHSGITGRALKQGLMQLELINPRDFTHDKHRSVDDHAYGGGPGMVMLAEPLLAAISAAKSKLNPTTKTIYLSPQGKQFDQNIAKESLEASSLIFIAGRYEGIDQRVIDNAVDEEWSIGDYVLSGGELAAMVMIDAITRLIPGAVGDQNSITEDSLSAGLLKHPQYSRPENLQGQTVPPVLLSGHHENIERWRKKQSLGVTWLKRPDLLDEKKLSIEEQTLLNEFIRERG